MTFSAHHHQRPTICPASHQDSGVWATVSAPEELSPRGPVLLPSPWGGSNQLLPGKDSGSPVGSPWAEMQEKVFHDEDAQRLGRLPEMQKAEDICGGGRTLEEQQEVMLGRWPLLSGSWREPGSKPWCGEDWFFHQMVEIKSWMQAGVYVRV